MVFFIPDDFIRDVLKTKTYPLSKPAIKFEPIISVTDNPGVHSFFHSMIPYFESERQPDPSLLELKFRELILTIADNPNNYELLSYFCSLLKEPLAVSLQRVMEDNYCYNLKLEEFAKLSNRSLSAFKRDFQKQFGTTPGKWLMDKRLHHSMHLLTHTDKTIGEVAFESGFENPTHFSRAFKLEFGITPTSRKKQVSN